MERALKAADRHLKLESKRQTRITVGGGAGGGSPTEHLFETSSDESSLPHPDQHQLLMSSSSTPQLPSIIEGDSVTSVHHPLVGEDGVIAEEQEQQQEQEERDDVSWGIPVLETNRSSKNAPKSQSSVLEPKEPSLSSSPSKGKKKKPHSSHVAKEAIDVVPTVGVDAPLSSVSGASSLSAPSAATQGSSEEGTPQLPSLGQGIRSKLGGLFTFPKKN